MPREREADPSSPWLPTSISENQNEQKWGRPR